VYLYYEQHLDAGGKVILTEMRVSSYSNGSLAIAWKNPAEATLFELVKTILKWPPIAARSYDEATKCWSYFDNWGNLVIDKLKETTRPISEITCIKVEDLAAQAVNNRVNLNPKKSTAKPEDFFYNYGKSVAAPAMTKETVAEKLKSLMGDVLDKSAYRKAALKYHPDRNHGDGSKMSELNSLWSVYNA
jgi:hypothetical protein